MLQSINIGKGTLCTLILSQTIYKKFLNRGYAVAINIDEIKEQLHNKRQPDDKVSLVVKRKDSLLKYSTKNVAAIKEVLEKYNIDISKINYLKHKNFFLESPWTIEKRIMLFQEIGIPNVELKYILSFPKTFYLSITLFKAHFFMDPSSNLAKNILSHLENPSLNHEDLTHLQDDMIFKIYYNEIFKYYLKKKLDFDENDLEKVQLKKKCTLIYNSFRLLPQVINFLKNDLQISKKTIAQNPWLLKLHPEQAKKNFNYLCTKMSDDKALNVITKCPRILESNPDDLKTLFSRFNDYKITINQVEKVPKILELTSEEFKRRINHLLSIPFTLVLSRHSRFLALVRNYQQILPRIRYLEDNNYKFATIYSLTTFHNYVEQLVSTKKSNKRNVRSFIESLLEAEDSEKLLDQLYRHQYWSFVPLIQMYETLEYLRNNFEKSAIHRHIYALLYKRENLQAVHEEILNDSEYKDLPQEIMLALCIYKLEIKTNFTGEGIFLSDNNETENMSENLDTNEEEKKNESSDHLLDKNESENLNVCMESSEEKNLSIISKLFQGTKFTTYSNDLSNFYKSLKTKMNRTRKKNDS